MKNFFAGVAFFHVACPGCVRRFLLRKNLINIVPANLMRLFILLPWMLIFCKKLHKGALEGYPPEA